MKLATDKSQNSVLDLQRNLERMCVIWRGNTCSLLGLPAALFSAPLLSRNAHHMLECHLLDFI